MTLSTKQLIYTKAIGPEYLGAFHVHPCPNCGRTTTGTGESVCPVCASQVEPANSLKRRQYMKELANE